MEDKREFSLLPGTATPLNQGVPRMGNVTIGFDYDTGKAGGPAPGGARMGNVTIGFEYDTGKTGDPARGGLRVDNPTHG